MLFKYKAINQSGAETEGSVEAVNIDIAISSLQRRGFVISSIKPSDEAGGLFAKEITLFERVKVKDVVILSRQIATLFTAQVSALRIFKLLSAEAENKALRKKLVEIAEDIQGVEAGDAVFAGSSALLGGMAQARGLQPLNKDGLQTYLAVSQEVK